jgi:hypothetical protein
MLSLMLANSVSALAKAVEVTTMEMLRRFKAFL